MNIFLVFLILGVIFLGYKKINSKKTKNLKLDKFKDKLQSTQTNIDRIFLREEEKTFSNPNINIYIGIYDNEEKVYKISTFITILGIINVPIIKYSVDWWNTLHQPASINILSKSSIHSSMLYPLLIMTAAFALFSLLIFLMKYNTELIKIKNKGLDRL